MCTNPWESQANTSDGMPAFIVQCVYFCVVMRANEAFPVWKPQYQQPLPGLAPFTLLGVRGAVQQQMLLKSGLEQACAVSPPRAGLPLQQVSGSVERHFVFAFALHSTYAASHTARADAEASSHKRYFWKPLSPCVLFEEQCEWGRGFTVLLNRKFSPLLHIALDILEAQLSWIQNDEMSGTGWGIRNWETKSIPLWVNSLMVC